MAFSEKEKQLIIWGKANGKSRGEVERALVNLRTGKTPQEAQPQATPEAPQGPGYLERVGGQYQNAAQDIISEVNRPAELANQGASPAQVGVSLAETGINTVGSVAGAAFAPVTEAVAPIIKPVVEKLAQIPGVGASLQAINSWAEQNPRAAKALSSVFNIATLGVGGAVEKVGKEVAGKVVQEAGELATKLLTKSEAQIESSVLKSFQKGVKPSAAGKLTATKLADYKDDVVTAVKTIRDNKGAMSFTDEVGEQVAGQSPQSLQQLSEALEQTKKAVFTKYDDLAKQANKAGAQVDLAPIAGELDAVINSKSLKLTNPKATQYADQLKQRLLSEGRLDATTAQDVIQQYNRSLEAFYKNPTYDNASQAAVDAMVANRMRKVLDEGISGITGEEYQALKSQYAALKTIEKDVLRATLRDARKNVTGLIDYTDIFSGGQVISGILSLNPAQIASGLTQKGIAQYFKFLNDPNRAIQQMFQAAEQLP